MVQESDSDGRQAGEAGNGLERHQCAERGQEARGGRRDLQAALAGGGIFPGRNSADAGGRVLIALNAAAQRRGKRSSERRADRRAPQERRTAREAHRVGGAL